jgi:hypothetical protein
LLIGLRRNATDKDFDAVDIGGSRKLIEWDIWEDRSIKKPVTWTTCSSTVFLSCGFNESAFSSLGHYKLEAEGSSLASKVPPPPIPSSSSASAPSPKTATSTNKTIKPFVATDDAEFDQNNYDFYDDLNVDLVHGRALFDAVGETAGSVVGAAGNL